MPIQSSAPAAMIPTALNEAAVFVERTLETLLPQPAGPEAALVEAMRRAVLAGDRAYRSFFVLQSGRLFGVDRQPLGRVAAAVECVAAAGRLAIEPGGSLTVLAGEGLMALAFHLLSAPVAISDPYVRAELMGSLAHCAGHAGLLGGLAAERPPGTDGEPRALPQISRIERMRTAALIAFCCEAGPLLGKASPAARHALSGYGQDAGLALAIAAELSGPAQTEGVVAALGAGRAHAQAEALAQQAVRHLDLFDEKAELLRAAAEYAVTRSV